jgi:hypothetical protein
VELGPEFSPWPHLPTLARLGLALAVGLFIGLERERRGKEAGLRTFGFAALLGGMGGLLGDLGFYAVSLVGGLVSSASAVASAASLVTSGVASPTVAGTGAVLASIASAAVNLPLIARVSGHRGLTIGLTIVIALGLLGLVLQQLVPPLPVAGR